MNNTNQMSRNFSEAARTIATSTIYTEKVWTGYSETTRSEVRKALKAQDICSSIGQYLDTEEMWIAVLPEERGEAAKVISEQR